MLSLEHAPAVPDPRDVLWKDLAELAASWRADAAVLVRCSRDATDLERCAEELERRIAERSVETELLTIDRAAQESGLSYSGVWKAIRAGRLRNYGRKGQPRIRRADVLRMGKAR